ncbi:hypothetical protein ACMD2_22778 [Ananas comosus]|uniref:C2 domain-containing protein n=1 Tax=Ananas comosus TaxID=4615 RepID=A0A199W9N1_ANACO|nr:hypothetical protein ACMD2_22778 [Ananas comosus]
MAEPEKKLNPEPKANNDEEELNQEPISIDKPSEEGGGGGGGGGGGELMGYLDVFVHQARDIHNICIYHKQDVYAKLSLTADSPAAALSTRIVNGGGRNPVFNQSLRLAVRSAAGSSLRCEIWMLSRVKNYLQDQLLGFALIPLADVLTAAAGKLVAAEFPLSSSDLFHSPAGFVQLSLSYVGSPPEVMPISPPPPLPLPPHSETDNYIPCEYEKVEFPDLNVVKENNIMVSEYFGIDMDTAQSAESLLTAENGNCPDREAGARVVESFSTENSVDSVSAFRNETPLSSVTTTDSPVVPPSTPQSADPPSEKEKVQEATEGQAESSPIGKSPSSDSVVKPIVSINIEPEETVVQQDIVDMYMKSMQQFTESLAKMKLPMDTENKSGPNSENGESSSEKQVAPSKGTGPKVFYGSRAFF